MAMPTNEKIVSLQDKLVSMTELPKELGWYEVQASDAVGDQARRLLETWTSIPPDQIDEHVSKIRKQAFAIYPYPCIGMFRFLDLSVLSMPVYPEVLERLKTGQRFFDLGCCFGQEVRQLASDGAPIENLTGTDLRQEFLDLGFELFQDKAKFPSTFFSSDVFDEGESSALRPFYGKEDVVYTGSFFHLFGYEDQVKVAHRVVQLLAPKPGSMLVGRQVGNENPGEYSQAGYQGEQSRYRHNPATWKKFWERVGEETGTKWDVEAYMEGWTAWPEGAKGPQSGTLTGEEKLERNRGEPGTKRLRFVVRRL